MKPILPLLLASLILPFYAASYPSSLPSPTGDFYQKADTDSLLRLSCSISLNFNLNNKRASNYFFSAAIGASYQVSWRKKG